MADRREPATLTYAEAVNEAIRIAMREDPNVILLGEDVAGGADVDHLVDDDAWGGALGVTKGSSRSSAASACSTRRSPRPAFIGAAVGAAATGLRPVAELMFVDFFGVLHGPDLRPGRQAALHVRRQGAAARS